MPHLSKKEIPKKVRETLEKQLLSLLKDTGAWDREVIFKELLTDTEKLVLAKRLALISLINRGFSVNRISRVLGISTSTVLRFELATESKQHVRTSKWLKRNSLEEKVSKLISFVVASAFGKRGKSFRQMVKDL